MSTVSEENDLSPQLQSPALAGGSQLSKHLSSDNQDPQVAAAPYSNGLNRSGTISSVLSDGVSSDRSRKSQYSNGNKYRWNRPYSRAERFIDIWSFFLRLLNKRWLYKKSWSYGGKITPEKQAARRQAQAVWIRKTCLNLGPTFIKVGQLFSTRADLFPIEYVNELSKLQDQVPAFDYSLPSTRLHQHGLGPECELDC